MMTVPIVCITKAFIKCILMNILNSFLLIVFPKELNLFSVLLKIKGFLGDHWLCHYFPQNPKLIIEIGKILMETHVDVK
jgi:hypothetical protein